MSVWVWRRVLHSSSAFPPTSLGFTILGEIFAYVTGCCCCLFVVVVVVVFTPTTEIVTFRRRGCGLYSICSVKWYVNLVEPILMFCQ